MKNIGMWTPRSVEEPIITNLTEIQVKLKLNSSPSPSPSPGQTNKNLEPTIVKWHFEVNRSHFLRVSRAVQFGAIYRSFQFSCWFCTNLGRELGKPYQIDFNFWKVFSPFPTALHFGMFILSELGELTAGIRSMLPDWVFRRFVCFFSCLNIYSGHW